jgi:hypothetical protein
MSSSLRPKPALRPKTLRAKLIAGQIAVLLALSVLTGVVAVLALHGFLTHNLDRQISELRQPPVGRLDGRGPNCSCAPNAWVGRTSVVPVTTASLCGKVKVRLSASAEAAG